MTQAIQGPATSAGVLEHVLASIEEDASAESGERFLRIVTDYLASAGAGEGPVSAARSADDVARRFAGEIPRAGRALADVVTSIARDIVVDANRLTHPMYMGHQVSAPLPAAIWTEAVIAALNQSIAVWEMSPSLTPLETRLVRWMCDLAGWGAEAGGTFTSGGTEATFTALLAARARALPDAWEDGVGADPPVVVCGEHAHYAVTRAVAQLGLGVRRAIAVPSRAWRMDTEALTATLDRLAARGAPVMAVVATAGTTATGSFDDLSVIGPECARRGLWLHVDGAHGASALLSASHRSRLAGLEHARSLAWDPHKMMLVPLSAGALLVRDERDLAAAFAQQAPYLFHGRDGARSWDQGTRSFMCSRRADALKAWVALQRYGASGLAALYDHLCDLARALHDRLVRHPAFEPLHEPESNILCFRWVGSGPRDEAALDAANLALRERWNRSGRGWITTTVLGGRRVLRVTMMNPRTRAEHVERLVHGLGEEAALT